jgi:hypothetical protein
MRFPHLFVCAGRCARGREGFLAQGLQGEPFPRVYLRRNLLNIKGLFEVRTSHPRSTKGEYTQRHNWMIIEAIRPFP